MSMDQLMDDFSTSILNDYHDMDNSAFDDEVDFIDETADRLSNRTVNSAGGSLTTTTYSIHQSPHVQFTLPTGDVVRRELADLLFVVNTQAPAGHHDTRAMLSQVKFANRPPSWDVDLYQYDLISRLPPFSVVSPQTHESFDLRSLQGTSFANFVLASRYRDPFYLSGPRMEEAISNVDFSTDNTTFNPDNYSSESKPNGFEYSRSILQRLIRRTYGRKVNPHSEIDRLIEHLYEIVHGTYSLKDPVRPDGGIQETDHPSPFAIIEIDVILEEELQ